MRGSGRERERERGGERERERERGRGRERERGRWRGGEGGRERRTKGREDEGGGRNGQVIMRRTSRGTGGVARGDQEEVG